LLSAGSECAAEELNRWYVWHSSFLAHYRLWREQSRPNPNRFRVAVLQVKQTNPSRKKTLVGLEVRKDGITVAIALVDTSGSTPGGAISNTFDAMGSRGLRRVHRKQQKSSGSMSGTNPKGELNGLVTKEAA
jgi:hypothetical protein